MSLCGAGGWRVGVFVLDLGERAVIVANSEELAQFPLPRRNNSTTQVSTGLSVWIDAPLDAPSGEVPDSIHVL
jgi:hypothetical protein